MPDVQKVNVEFQIKDREAFLAALQTATSYNGGMRDLVIGYRADDHVQRRSALETFANAMELVLRKHEHKTTWRDRPLEGLVRLLMLEIEEFKCALEFFEVKEARKELIDVANYCLIVSDRLSMLNQDQTLKIQNAKNNP